MLATARSPCCRARRTSCRWPWCKLPIVGTKAISLAVARRDLRSAAVVMISTRRSTSEGMFSAGERSVPDRLDIGAERRTDADAAGGEIADEAALAGADPQHVVQDQHLPGARSTGADADGRNRERRRHLGCQSGRNEFEHQHRRPGLLQQSRIVGKLGRRLVAAALDLVA